MKIDNVIMSVNDNTYYQAYWPIVSHMWYVLGYRPILYWTTNNPEDFPYPSQYGEVYKLPILHLMPPDEVSHNLHLQRFGERGERLYHEDQQRRNSVQNSAFGRIFGAATISGINMICDIDLLPISPDWYSEPIKDYPDTCMVSLGASFGYLMRHRRLAMCYYIGSHLTWQELITVRTSLTLPVHYDENLAASYQKVLSTVPNEPNKLDHTSLINDEGYMMARLEQWISSKQIQQGKISGKSVAYAADPFRIVWRYGRALWDPATQLSHLSDFWETFLPKPQTSIEEITKVSEAIMEYWKLNNV